MYIGEPSFLCPMMIRASHRPSERFRIVPSPCGLRFAILQINPFFVNSACRIRGVTHRIPRMMFFIVTPDFLSVVFFVLQTYHMFERISSVFSNSYQIVIKAPLIHNNSLPLGLVLTALLLVDAVVIDRMLLAVHILTSLVEDIACVIKEIAYTDDDPCVQPLFDRT